MINIALLGFGTVGSGVAEVLTECKANIEKRLDIEFNIKYILDLRSFPGSPFENLITNDFNTILNDPDVSIVAEMMGGSHPAYDFTKAALLAGKNVVTSNKEVVSKFGPELMVIAAEKGVRYLFEASVGGGIPIIRPLMNDFSLNSVSSITGILNGTTNYILTMMAGGMDFDTALKSAQANGYAEANPAADIMGTDAARKIAILAALTTGILVSPDDVSTEGITGISSMDVAAAEAIGCTIKLIAHTEQINGKILCTVAPTMLSLSHPLANISDVFNGVLVTADALGDVMFYGRGAGKLPTASAVMSDIVDIMAARASASPAWKVADPEDICPKSDYVCRTAYIFKTLNDAQNASDILGKYESLTEFDGGYVAVSAPISEGERASLIEKSCSKPISSIRIL